MCNIVHPVLEYAWLPAMLNYWNCCFQIYVGPCSLINGGGSFLVRGADWEYRISGSRGSGGLCPPDAEAISVLCGSKFTKINI